MVEDGFHTNQLRVHQASDLLLFNKVHLIKIADVKLCGNAAATTLGLPHTDLLAFAGLPQTHSVSSSPQPGLGVRRSYDGRVGGFGRRARKKRRVVEGRNRQQNVSFIPENTKTTLKHDFDIFRD